MRSRCTRLSVCAAQVMAMNESPVFLLMNIRLHQAQKELPVLLFESGVGPPRCDMQGRRLPWSHSIHAWRAELHSVDGLPQSVFVQSKYSVEVWAACVAWLARRRRFCRPAYGGGPDTRSRLQTSEAERIGINQVAKVLPSGNDKGTDQRAPALAAALGRAKCVGLHSHG